jgi:hypothetical protein
MNCVEYRVRNAFINAYERVDDGIEQCNDRTHHRSDAVVNADEKVAYRSYDGYDRGRDGHICAPYPVIDGIDYSLGKCRSNA